MVILSQISKCSVNRQSDLLYARIHDSFLLWSSPMITARKRALSASSFKRIWIPIWCNPHFYSPVMKTQFIIVKHTKTNPIPMRTLAKIEASGELQRTMERWKSEWSHPAKRDLNITDLVRARAAYAYQLSNRAEKLIALPKANIYTPRTQLRRGRQRRVRAYVYILSREGITVNSGMMQATRWRSGCALCI